MITITNSKNDTVTIRDGGNVVTKGRSPQHHSMAKHIIDNADLNGYNVVVNEYDNHQVILTRKTQENENVSSG